MVKTKSVLVTLIVIATVACTNSVPTGSNVRNGSEPFPTIENFQDLNKEYTFSTKALTKAYLKRKIFRWLTAPANGPLLVREISYARFKHPQIFCSIISEDSGLLIAINDIDEVSARKDIDTPFRLFLDEGCNPDFDVSTIAGSDQGYLDGNGIDAQFYAPSGITVDNSGNLYVSEFNNHKIRKIDNTVNHVVSTIAGSSAGFLDGNGTEAMFRNPYGMTADSSGNLYVADWGNHAIRKIDNSVNHFVSTIAGGSSAGYLDGDGTVAMFNYPHGITVDNAGNLYVADYSNHRIRKIANDVSNTVSTLAGSSSGYLDGNGTEAMLVGPVGITIDNGGNLYVTDWADQKIRKIDNSVNHFVSTIAGSSGGYLDGNGSVAMFSSPGDIAVDNQGNLYVVDTGNNVIRKIDNTVNHVVSTLAGSSVGYLDGNASDARFNNPRLITIDSSGNLYVTEWGNQKIRKIAQ